LAWLAVGALLMWILPRISGTSITRIGGGSRLIWLVLGGLVAFEIFRLVSRGVDWLFAPSSYPSNRRGSRGVRLRSETVGPTAYRAVSPNSVREISWRRRLTELSGSLATAGLATAVVTAVLANVTQFFGSTAMIGHFATGTLIGSWALLTIGKIREGLPRERYIDRMLLAGVGMLIGIALFQLDDWLLIDLLGDGSAHRHSLLAMTNASLASDSRHLLAEGYIAFFAMLFALRRWWWHTDSLRPHRFRVSSVCLTAIVGALAALVWGFPVLWGTVWAASLSSVVQLAAVWTPREHRQ